MIADRERVVCSFCGRDVGDARHVRAWEYDGWSFNPVCSNGLTGGLAMIHGPYIICKDCFQIAWDAMGRSVEEKIAIQKKKAADADTPKEDSDDGQE